MPLLVFLVGATIETCDLIFLNNALASAAYSGTLEASRLGSTEASVRSQINQALAAAGIEDTSVTVTGPAASFDQAKRGEFAHIEITAQIENNLRIGGFVRGNPQVAVHVRALK